MYVYCIFILWYILLQCTTIKMYFVKLTIYSDRHDIAEILLNVALKYYLNPHVIDVL